MGGTRIWSPLSPSLHAWRDFEGPLLLLDGLARDRISRGALRDPLLQLAEEMEWLRQHAGARVAAVDLPSGINADTGEISSGTVTADITFMIGNRQMWLACRSCCQCHWRAGTGPRRTSDIRRNGFRAGIDLAADHEHRKIPSPISISTRAWRDAWPSSPAPSDIPVLPFLPQPEPCAAEQASSPFMFRLHAASAIASRCPPEIIVRGYSIARRTAGIWMCDSARRWMRNR